MKNLIHLTLVTAFLFSLIGCKKEGCTDNDATNYDSDAKKDDGSCIYPEEPVDQRDQYLGNYTVTDSAFGSGGSTFVSTSSYLLIVTKNATVSDTIFLNNLSNGGKDFFAVMSGSAFNIPSQNVDGSPYLLYGSGSFSGNQISYSTHSGPGGNFIHEGQGSK